jgi:ferredoxin, 2Fe-2S
LPDIVFIHPDGTRQGFEAPVGVSLMQAATGVGVRGILADCGGSLMCATCHVYVEPAWMGALPPPQADELDLLDCTSSERRPTSRLSCQIRLDADLDGLTVSLPQTQQ